MSQCFHFLRRHLRYSLLEAMPITLATSVVDGRSSGKGLVETTSQLVIFTTRIFISWSTWECSVHVGRSFSLIQTNIIFWFMMICIVSLSWTGTTILTAIKKTVDPKTEVVYEENPSSDSVKSGKFSYAVVVVGEHPYAETSGDSTSLTIPDPGPATIMNVCGAVKCVVVVISGRPVVLQPYVPLVDALVAAWLPGTEGQGVADVLFGDYGFTGKLPRTWFKTVDQLPMNVGDAHYDPLFPFGFGLTTKPTKSEWDFSLWFTYFRPYIRKKQWIIFRESE